jgi:protein-tyrosine kinase
MGKISDALDRHNKEKPTKKVESLPKEKPRRLITEEPETTMARSLGRRNLFSEKLVVLSAPDSAEAETFRILRGRILYAKDRERPRSIMVTSTFPGEGKTFVAGNLAVSLALSMDEYVLAMDCDLRRPSLHALCGFPNPDGLHEYLTGKRKLEDVITRTKIDKFSLLPAGRVPRNPEELLASAAMEGFIKEVRDHYQDRYVVIDSPPTHITAETRVLAEYVDGIVFVVMAHGSPRKEVQRSMEVLGRDKILGVVFNGYTQAHKTYHKYYNKYYKKK